MVCYYTIRHWPFYFIAKKETWEHFEKLDEYFDRQTMDEKLTKFMEDSLTFQTNIKQLVTDTNKTIFELSQDVASLDKKFNKMDGRITNLEHNLTGQIATLKKRVSDVEISAEFTSKKFDEFKIVVDNNKIEHLTLKQQLDHVQNDLENEKHARNIDQQYFRSSFFLKVHGVPMQKGEEDSIGSAEGAEDEGKKGRSTSANNQVSLTIIREIFAHADIKDFSEQQVDVCHRTGKYLFSPIIVLFSKKQDRENLFRQRHKLNNLKLDELHLDYNGDAVHEWRGEQKQKIPTVEWNDKLPKIIIREHLTTTNNSLLKIVLPVARQKNYRFPGYLSKGTIHVRKTDTSKPIQIRCNEDVQKIV